MLSLKVLGGKLEIPDDLSGDGNLDEIFISNVKIDQISFSRLFSSAKVTKLTLHEILPLTTF